MNGRHLTHGFWLAVTVGTFFVGAQLARPSAPSNKRSDTNPSPYWSDRSAQPRTSLSGTPTKPGAAPSAVIAAQGARETAYGALAAVNPALARLLAESVDRPLSGEEIEALVLAAIQSASPLERRKAFDRVLAEIASDEFTVEQAMAIRHAMAENGADGEMWQLFDYTWGAHDPAAAIAYIDEIPERYRRGYTGNMLPGLASADPDAAIELVAGFEGSFRAQMIPRLIEGLADRDPALATDYVMGLAEAGDPSARDYMQRLAREVLGNSGFEASREWADSLPDSPLLGHALMPIANEFTRRDPNAAASWAQGYLDTPGASRVFGEIVRNWGDQDAAAAWTDSLPPGQARLDATSAVWGHRGATDPAGAARDLLELPDSPTRNFAINGFISSLAHRDAEAATIWAADISEPGLRTAAVVRAGRQFVRQDPDTAQQWFSNAPDLPDNVWTQVGGEK